MSDKIRIATYYPNQIEPEIKYIDNSLEAMQQEVGGYIEAVGIDENLSIICNEEGKLMGLPANKPLKFDGQIVDILMGNFFISRVDPETGESIDITDKDIAFAKSIF
jgi:hypothetical protein